MSRCSEVLYQDSSYCLPCWSDPKDRLPSTPLSHSNYHEGSRDAHEKKVSLKKYSHGRMKHSELKLPINHTIVLDNYSKTARVFDHLPPEPTIACSPIRITFAHQPRTAPHEQRYSCPVSEAVFEEKHAWSAAGKPESRVLAKTTKLQRIMPARSEQLKKTRKNVPFHQVVNLSELKESVCSFTDSSKQQERLEESQILMDYFHPNEKRISEMEEYMKSKELSLAQSRHCQK